MLCYRHCSQCPFNYNILIFSGYLPKLHIIVDKLSMRMVKNLASGSLFDHKMAICSHKVRFQKMFPV